MRTSAADTWYRAGTRQGAASEFGSTVDAGKGPNVTIIPANVFEIPKRFEAILPSLC